MSRASQEEIRPSSSPRRRGPSIGLDTGETDDGCGTREVVLCEAESTTEWYKAIERRDCKTLIKLLTSKGGSALLLKTGEAGRTALHVAAIQGSLELVDAIQSLPPGTVDVQTAEKLTDAIDGRCTMTAGDIAFFTVGYKDPDNFRVLGGGRVHEKFPRNPGRLIDVWRSNYDLTEADVNSLEETITYVWQEGCDQGRYKGLIESFEENVDYNFYSSRLFLFLFHHACSRVGGGEFIDDVIKRCRDERIKEVMELRDLQGESIDDVTKRCGDERVKKLMELRDLQGRTPQHVAIAVTPVEVRDAMLKSITNSLAVENARSCIIQRGLQYWGVRDGRGWTPEHVAKRPSSSPRRRGDSIGLDTGEADDGCGTREVVLCEAESTTEWYKAIERRDCKTLIKLLTSKGGSALLLKTGEAGRTALHVAAIQGSLELVDTIQSLPPGTVDVQTAEKLTDAIDGRCTMTAGDIAFFLVGYKNRDHFKVLGGGRVHEKFPRNPGRLIDVWRSNYDLTEADVNSLEETITYVWQEGCDQGRYKGLIESFEENVDYNFYSSRLFLFLFHHACSRVGGGEFIDDVIKRCRDERIKEVMELRDLQGESIDDVMKRCGDERVKKLMELRDLQGRTPQHVAIAVTPVEIRDGVLRSIRGVQSWGVRDGRGWTPVHVAATQPFSDSLSELLHYVEVGVLEARICANSVKDNRNTTYCTAFHLAVLHNNPIFIHLLRDRSQVLLWGTLQRNIYFGGFDYNRGRRWCAFTLALLLGDERLVQSISFRSGVPEKSGRGAIPPICLAAALGNTNVLRQLMNDSRFDPFERDSFGHTSLHYAANGVIEPSSENTCGSFVKVVHKLTDRTVIKPRQAQTYVSVVDVPNVAWLDARYGSSTEETKIDKGFSGRKGCITMLLQGGLDMWQKDDQGKIADPGVGITDDEFIIWWHEKMAKETLEMRNNLNQGGNAISVIGALIATASYVGPLQPPLNYGPDPLTSDNTGYAHVWDLPVQIFMMSNSLSFYLAIASIMLAVVPSLPMPQESVWEELERTRKTVASAICVLLLSVVGILVSYAAASIAVMPKHTSFVNVRWTSYPAVVGGFTCLIGIVLFIIRVLRLMFPDKCRWLRRVWEKVVRKVWEKVFRKVFRNMLEKVLEKVAGYVSETRVVDEFEEYILDLDLEGTFLQFLHFATMRFCGRWNR